MTKTILATTYAVNPYKGSEDGMGWNFVLQIARFNKVIAITRENNQQHIEKYMVENPNPLYKNITFKYYDLPKWAYFWKKGERGAMLYYNLWQYGVAGFAKQFAKEVDVVHNVNFHNDWTPTFLYKLKKPLVWGPIGHHPRVPNEYLPNKHKFKNALRESAIWIIKKIYWNFNPWLYISKSRAKLIFVMNSEVMDELSPKPSKVQILPSVGCEFPTETELITEHATFEILSVGRFVPLKGFGITIDAFHAFLQLLPKEKRSFVRLTLVGKGPLKDNLMEQSYKLGISANVRFIDWIDRAELAEIYKSSDLFLFPSHEGAGMVVAEAFSYKVPVLCFNNSGPGEFLHPDSILRVSYTNYKQSILDFSLLMQLYYLSPMFQEKEKKLAFNRFITWLNWDVKGEILNEAYNKVLNA
jgi:glycosyltransferase involved in cell wall biosynthesis